MTQSNFLRWSFNDQYRVLGEEENFRRFVCENLDEIETEAGARFGVLGIMSVPDNYESIFEFNRNGEKKASGPKPRLPDLLPSTRARGAPPRVEPPPSYRAMGTLREAARDRDWQGEATI